MNVTSSSPSFAPFRRSVTRATALLALGAATVALAQTNSDDARRRGGEQDGNRRGGSAQDMQGRMLSALRDRLGVTNDEEWTVISERLMKLMELRRSMPGASFGGFRGGPPSGGGEASGRGFPSRGGRTGGSPEAEALQAAVNDKMPEAEIKARLARLRQTKKANEAKLEQAQEELRAVLTVRQEAMAVLLGLLP